MDKKRNDIDTTQTVIIKKSTWRLIGILVLLIIAPCICICIESVVKSIPVDPGLMGKWFIYWAGVKLFLRGIRQMASSGKLFFKIFRPRPHDNIIKIRELGLANIALGLMGILSLVNDQWRLLTGIVGALFFCFEVIQLFVSKPATGREILVMITDLWLFTIVLLYLFFTLRG